MNTNQKLCSKCGKILSRENFHSDKQKSDGKCSRCKFCKNKDVKAYYETNRDKITEDRRAYHAVNRESVNRSRRKHPEISGRGEFNRVNPTHFDFGASLRKPAGESSFARLIRQYKANAARRNLDFLLNDSDVRSLTSSNCEYCGAKPDQRMQSKDANGAYLYNGIDRLDSTKGYSMDNCVPSCKICNKAKSAMTYQAWREWLNRIVVFHVAGNVGFKKTIKGDGIPKSLAQ